MYAHIYTAVRGYSRSRQSRASATEPTYGSPHASLALSLATLPLGGATPCQNVVGREGACTSSSQKAATTLCEAPPSK
eukprot:scaffold104660_cov60-Phaeocystis_antarctica.AAC.2